MLKNCLIIVILCLTSFSWQIKRENKCSCSQYKFKNECSTFIYECYWDNQSKTCGPYDCPKYSNDKYVCRDWKNCYYNLESEQCEEFTSCQDLPFQSNEKCSFAKYHCNYYSGDTCSDFSCSNYTVTDCPVNYARCYVYENECRPIISCSQYQSDDNYCLGEPFECFYDGNGCKESTCQDLSLEYCWFTLNTNTVQSCIIEGNQCVDAQDSSQLKTPEDCVLNTYGAYHWSSNDENDGDCIACHPDPNLDASLRVIIALFIMLS